MEEIRSIGLPDHRQKVTLLVVSTMLALRWIEENVTKYREVTTPTAESIYAIDYSRRLELFETACKLFAIPTEVRHIWSRLRYFPWFRATLTSWLYMTTKDHMRKHQKEYRQLVPGRDWARSFQQTPVDPPKCDHDRMEESGKDV